MHRRNFGCFSTLSAVSTAAMIATAAAPAQADFKVKQPDAEYGELELEEIGSYGRSGNPATNNERIFVHELEYGVTNFWRTGIELETGRDAGPGNRLKIEQVTWENWLVFGERGQYWLDPALFIEYGRATLTGAPDEIKLGPILRKEIWGTSNTVNVFFEKEIGSFAGGRPIFSYAWETRLLTGWPVEPGFQAYGEPGPIGHFASLSSQDHRAGPQLFTELHNFGPGTLKANGGVLFGLTPVAPRQTWRWQLEYEVRF
jgi:hypothetical protein